MPEIWFWEKICSPHQAGMLTKLAAMGCKVKYIVEEVLTTDRVRQGWQVPDIPEVQLEFMQSVYDVDRLIASAPIGAIHICDGIRSNGMVAAVRYALRKNGLRFWVFMETVDDSGLRGVLKRVEYRRLFFRWRKSVLGILAAGEITMDWVIRRGVSQDLAYPFAYFLPKIQVSPSADFREKPLYQFVYVGQIEKRKRLGLLIDALAVVKDQFEFTLLVIGAGALESQLHLVAEHKLPGRVIWFGRIAMDKVSEEMARSDCLVLPSRHDGWGAVVSEALMVGTPVISSDGCGASVVVKASNYGGVFRKTDLQALIGLLCQELERGRITQDQRSSLAEWAHCLTADAGADYLLKILGSENRMTRPQIPWATGES